MERRNFIVAGLMAIVYAIFPFLRPKSITYGGMDLRELLRGNSEFRKLEIPYYIMPGIAIGLLHRDLVKVNEPICFASEGNDWYRVEELTGTTGGTRVTPAS